MLDGKILSAVLATLTAVAVSTTGGADLSDQALETDPADMEMDVMGLLKNPVQQLREMVTTTPEPENQLHAELVATDIGNETFQVQNARLTPENTTEIEFGTHRIASDENVVIHGFSGSVLPANSSIKLSGTAEVLKTSEVNISGTSAVDCTLETNRMEMSGIEQSSISLASVRGTINSSVSTEFDSKRTLSIDSFSGDIVLELEKSSIILDGKVNKLSSGDFQFGN